MTLITRRTALFAAGLAATPIPAWARDFSGGSFTHSVASGDPTATAVILWTRFVPTPGGSGEIGWEIAEDEAFARVVGRGRALARLTNDYCIKVDAQGLRPGRRYFYRFLGGSGPSPIGMTQTAPQGRTPSMTLALFSCSNYAFGHFHAYGHAAAREEIDLCIHVGDYIYEYGRGTYPSEAQAVPGRVLEPAHEIVSLEDYYARYQTYRSDPNLQELHRLKPWSVVWDDHELANNTWYDGAENHSPNTEGTFAQRFASAWKAYLDWMPMRPPSGQAGRIHRSLEWGDLAGIVMMDTRWYGREQQLDYGAALAAVADQGPAAQMAAIAALQTQVQAQDRTLLGAEQEAWLTGELERFQGARKTWTVLAQQLVFGRQLAPAGIANLLPPDTAPYARRFAELGGMLGVAGLEFNLDAWGGYPAARERLVQTVLRNANNAVILGGDSHNCWVNNVPGGPNGLAAMLEIAGTSVTSPGFESYLSNAAPGQREEMLRAPNEAMVYCNVTDKGYAALTLQRDSAAADLVFFSVPGVRSPQAPEPTRVRLEAEAVRGPGVGGWSVRG